MLPIVTVSPPSVEGWLERVGTLTTGAREWYALRGNKLSTRHARDYTEETAAVYVRGLNQSVALSSPALGSSGAKLCFSVSHTSGGAGEWLLKAPNETEFQNWITALTALLVGEGRDPENAASLLERPTSPMYAFSALKRSLWTHTYRSRFFELARSGTELIYYEKEGMPARGRFILTHVDLVPHNDTVESSNMPFLSSAVELHFRSAGGEAVQLQFTDPALAVKICKAVRAALRRTDELCWSGNMMETISDSAGALAVLGNRREAAFLMMPPPSRKHSYNTSVITPEQAKAALRFRASLPSFLFFGGSAMSAIPAVVQLSSTSAARKLLHRIPSGGTSSNTFSQLEISNAIFGGACAHPLPVHPFEENQGAKLSPRPRVGHVLASTGGSLFLHGGLLCHESSATSTTPTTLSDFWVLNFSRAERLAWVVLSQGGSSPLLPGLHHHTMTAVQFSSQKQPKESSGEGKALVICGGMDAEGELQSAVRCYIPSKNQVKVLESLPTPRAGHSTFTLVDDRVLFVIGGIYETADVGKFSFIEGLDPRTRRWVTPTCVGCPFPIHGKSSFLLPPCTTLNNTAFVLLAAPGTDVIQGTPPLLRASSTVSKQDLEKAQQRMACCAAVTGNPLLFRLVPLTTSTFGDEVPMLFVQYIETLGKVPQPFSGQCLLSYIDPMGDAYLVLCGNGGSAAAEAPSEGTEEQGTAGKVAGKAWGLIAGLGRAVASAAKTVGGTVNHEATFSATRPGLLQLLLPHDQKLSRHSEKSAESDDE